MSGTIKQSLQPNGLRALVSCPNCEENGRKQILGELKGDSFLIMRFHNAYTRIRGEFEVICDFCGEPVYFRTLRKENINGTMSNNRIQGLYWQGTFQGTYQERSYSNGATTGSII